MITYIYRSLAQRQGFNLLSAPEQGAARIGSVYYVTEPGCAAALNTMAREGTPVKLFFAMDLPDQRRYKPQPIPDSGWNSVLLSKVAGKSAEADLAAGNPKLQAEVSTALSALEKTQAQIWFATRQYSSVQISRAMKNELKAQGINAASELGGGATGALAPHAELIVQKFEFNGSSLRGRRGGILARFMEAFSARITAGDQAQDSSAFRQATYATAAFKPVTALFDPAACSHK